MPLLSPSTLDLSYLTLPLTSLISLYPWPLLSHSTLDLSCLPLSLTSLISLYPWPLLSHYPWPLLSHSTLDLSSYLTLPLTSLISLPSTLMAQIASIESCTQRVHDWLLNNGLHLNPSKSEAIAFSNPRSKPLVALAESVKTITVAGSPIKLQSSIKSLGVYLDSHMSFDKHVSEICKASYFHIRALRHIRSSPDHWSSKNGGRGNSRLSPWLL